MNKTCIKCDSLMKERICDCGWLMPLAQFVEQRIPDQPKKCEEFKLPSEINKSEEIAEYWLDQINETIRFRRNKPDV